MLISLTRIVKMAGQNFWRNFWLSVVTLSILILTLFSVNLLLSLNFLTQEVTRLIQEKVDISLYLKPKTNEAEVENLRTYLLSLPNVIAVEYDTADAVLEKFQKKHQNDEFVASSLKELDSNPLGGTLVIRTKKIEDYKIVASLLEQTTFANLIKDKDFSDHELLVKKLSSIISSVERLGIAVALIFALIAGLIVFNTIRIAIYTHREEIGIMRLVGASNWFIRAPFLFETAIYSFLACALTMSLVYPFLHFVAEPALVGFLEAESGFLVKHFNKNLLEIFVLQFLGIVFLSMASSGLAMSRYLRK